MNKLARNMHKTFILKQVMQTAKCSAVCSMNNRYFSQYGRTRMHKM
jgi:hypothetical protein